MLPQGAAGVLTPAVEVGMRHDGGDAEQGLGLDLSGGLDWSVPALGLAARVSGRGLLVHEADGLGVGRGRVAGYDPDPPRSWGRSCRWRRGGADRRSAVRRRCDAADAGGAAAARRQAERGSGLGAAAICGCGHSVRGAGTGRAGTGRAGRDYRLGYRLSVPVVVGRPFTLKLEGIRHEPVAPAAAAEHTVTLHATMRWKFVANHMDHAQRPSLGDRYGRLGISPDGYLLGVQLLGWDGRC